MKIAIYARVSTDDQKADLQLDALKQYAENGSVVVFKEYVDHISGAKPSRPALDEMLADARRRRFDAVVVWKIDRLGRSVAHLLTILTELHALNVAFVSLQEAIDTGVEWYLPFWEPWRSLSGLLLRSVFERVWQLPKSAASIAVALICLSMLRWSEKNARRA